MTYSEKKKLLDVDVLPNLQGLEYYKGGVFTLKSESSLSDGLKSESTDFKDQQYVPWVDEFSYTDLHGANNPTSPYYNADAAEQGWITSIKFQGPAGACWAFSIVAAFEAKANLYYNQQLHLDLSEQQLISCTGVGTAEFGGDVGRGMRWATMNGVVNEDCFPYQALDVDSSLICSSPSELMKSEGAIAFRFAEQLYHNPAGALKQILINKGPVSLVVSSWNHALLLVGYSTLNLNKTIELPVNGDIQQGFETLVIDANSELLGKTCWNIKNSWGADWGTDGYLQLVIDDYNNITGSAVLAGEMSSKTLTKADVKCLDLDGDGYYNWGIGPRPATCPNNLDADGDDSNPMYGPRNEFGQLTLIGALINVSIEGPDVLESGKGEYSIMNLPANASISHWSCSNNMDITPGNDNSAISITVKNDNGLGAISAFFDYQGKNYQASRTVGLSENQIIFLEQRNSLPAPLTSMASIADFDLDGDYDLVYNIKHTMSNLPYPDPSETSCEYYENNNGFQKKENVINYEGGERTRFIVKDINNDFFPDLTIIADDWFYDPTSPNLTNLISTRDIYTNQQNGLFKQSSILNNSNVYINGEQCYIDFKQNAELDLAFVSGDKTIIVKSILNESTQLNQNVEGYFPTPIWLDMNNDGFTDLLNVQTPANFIGDTTGIIQSYINQNGKTLFPLEIRPLIENPDPDYQYGELKCLAADFNNDGFMDVLVNFTNIYNGAAFAGTLTVYLNDQNNGFIPQAIETIEGVETDFATANFAIGDFNNDNFNDIIYTGYNSNYNLSQRLIRLLLNDGSGHFKSYALNTEGIEQIGTIQPADFNGDGNLDFLLSGRVNNVGICGQDIYSHYGKTDILLNKGTWPTLEKPIAPSNLELITVAQDSLKFKWDKLTDGGYSYNIKIGTTSGGGEIVSCNALPSGKLSVVEMGNASLRGFYLLNKKLEPGTYYWSVQAIDNAFRGGEFAAEQTFTIENNINTSTSENVVNAIVIRPNPASEFVLFDTGMKSNIWVDIFNIQGQIVISQNLSDNNKVLVNGLKNGLYTCRIIEDGKISIQKLLIRK